MSHADCESGRAASAVIECLLAYRLGQRVDFRGGNRKSQLVMVAAAAPGAWPTIPVGLLIVK